MDNSKPYTFDRVIRLIIGTLVVVAFFLLVRRLSSVLLPFVIGWFIAYLIYPIVLLVQYKFKVKYRVPSILIVFAFFAGLIALFIWLVVPQIVAEFSKTGILFHTYITKVSTDGGWLAKVNDFIVQRFGNGQVEDWLSFDHINSLIDRVFPQFVNLLSGTKRVIFAIISIILVFLYLFFILKDFEFVGNMFKELLPPKYKTFLSGFVTDVKNGMNRYFRGQALIAAIVGVSFAIGFKIVGLPLGITMGLFIGLLNLIPYMQTVGFPFVILLALLKSLETGQSFWGLMLFLVIVFVIVQSTQDLLLTPKIMGREMGLKPVVILLSLSIWGSLLGVIGMIIALPFSTLLLSYYKRYIIGGHSITEEIKEVRESDVPPEAEKTPVGNKKP